VANYSSEKFSPTT